MQPAVADLTGILQNLSNSSRKERDLIERAYERARTAHEGQQRKSGEPYITHCLAVAQILADMGMDSTTVAARRR
jgi:guanosine-3',5'-bis(diphosphate) 3'-pyrophosphohydrolase